MTSPGNLISSILKHDTKQNTYKIALLRAINDVVLAYPDMLAHGRDVAIPLHMLARYWIAYYWSFADETMPIYQGNRAMRGGKRTNDMAFRPHLTRLRREWQHVMNSDVRPADGYFLINELGVPRKYHAYQDNAGRLIQTYERTVRKIAATLRQPIRYAGTDTGEDYGVFRQSARLRDLDSVTAVPGTEPDDRCIVVPASMWKAFQDNSLYIEALCIHEWSLFVEGVEQDGNVSIGRGDIFTLLTARPENRVALTWERNYIDILMQEGMAFTCVWTHQRLPEREYELDHLIPVSVYPMNELWNLVPTHPDANLKKSDKIPIYKLLDLARSPLTVTYRNYQQHPALMKALAEDSAVRFTTLFPLSHQFPDELAGRVIDFMEHVAVSRNLARVENF